MVKLVSHLSGNVIYLNPSAIMLIEPEGDYSRLVLTTGQTVDVVGLPDEVVARIHAPADAPLTPAKPPSPGEPR